MTEPTLSKAAQHQQQQLWYSANLLRSKRESGDVEQTQVWVSRKARLAFQFRRAAREEEGLTEWGTLKKKGEP